MAVPDAMYTSNPICKYAFSWTIENFSRTSLEVRGPLFSPIPGYADKFCFGLKFKTVTKSEEDYYDYRSKRNVMVSNNYSVLDVNLICLNELDCHRSVVGDITLSNKDKILFKQVTSVIKVTETTTLVHYTKYLPKEKCSSTSFLEMGLGKTDLFLQGTLQFSGYGVTSSIYSVQPLNSFGDILNDFKTMYETGLGSDVTFTVDEEKIHAHKAILSSRSLVFAKMFEHDMLENNTNNVSVEDIDSHTFRCFLKFLYTGVVDDEKYETVKALYSVAEKYQVKSLLKVCFGHLVKQLSIETVCSVLVLADLHSDEELKNIVKIFIRENFVNFMGTTEWAELVSTKPKLADEVLSYIKSIYN